jgi:hypothetical protein
VLLWQANKQEFFGGNMHGLRSGTYLTVPPHLADGMAVLSKADAQRLVAEQWEAWQTLRRTPGGQQQVEPAEKEAVVLAKEPLPLPENPPPPAEAKPPQPAAAGPQTRNASAAMAPDMRFLLQRMEELLTQRFAQTDSQGGAVTFVSTTELQGALHVLEERLLQRVQESLQPFTEMQQDTVVLKRFASRGEQPTLLEQWLSSSSIVYILIVQNALLLLLAAGILWRWYRSRTGQHR